MTSARRVGAALAALALSAAAAAVPGTARAQEAGGELAGRVVDATSGEPVSGARVAADGPTPVETVTSPDGAWRLEGLAPGVRAITIEHLSYATAGTEVEIAAAGAAAESEPLVIRLTPRPVALDAVVVTSGRRIQKLADVPVATRLVSRREIEETGAADLASVLSERTGIELSGGHPVGAGLMIQGMDSERVLILVDGRPFIGRIAGSVDASRIPTSMIERIEVVEGPQSTLYGSEAMGGVVNVVTRKAADGAPGGGWDAATSVTAGTEGRLDAAVSTDATVGDVSVAADVGRRAIEVTPGIDAGGDADSRTERWDARADLEWRAGGAGGGADGDGLRLLAGGYLLDEDQRWRGGQIYSFADNTQWSAHAGAEWTKGRHRIAPTISATAFDHLARSSTSEEPVAGTGEEETQRLLEGEVLYGLSLGRHALDAGVELRRDAITSDRVSGEDRTEGTFETFAQATLALGEFTVVPGVRLSASEPWGTHWTPRVAAMFRPVPELALRASAGQGFRAPNFKERYMEFLNIGPGFGYVVRGNPDLQPEVSRNLTVGAEWAGERVYARVQAYDNAFDDFIETQAVADSSGVTVYTYGNIEDGFTRGVELEAGVTRGAWRLEGGYGLLRAERADTGEPLLGRPRSSAHVTLGHARPTGFRASMTGVMTGSTPMARTDAGTEYRDAFFRLDARLAHALPLGLEVAVGVDNLFDATTDDWPGFTGRLVYTTLTWDIR